jgi:hypothetical protein
MKFSELVGLVPVSIVVGSKKIKKPCEGVQMGDRYPETKITGTAT